MQKITPTRDLEGEVDDKNLTWSPFYCKNLSEQLDGNSSENN